MVVVRCEWREGEGEEGGGEGEGEEGGRERERERERERKIKSMTALDRETFYHMYYPLHTLGWYRVALHQSPHLIIPPSLLKAQIGKQHTSTATHLSPLLLMFSPHCIVAFTP